MQCLNNFYKYRCLNEIKCPDPYCFDFGQEEYRSKNDEIFDSNFIKTTKYTWYSFLPISLFYQYYNRYVNCFFLLIAILQSIPEISPLQTPTDWGPVIIVLLVSMAREAFEFYQHSQLDQQQNKEKVQIFKNGKFIQVKWSQLVVGDICKVKQNDMFPADLILLTSSSQDGTAFIQTTNLDGQMNLKSRKAISQTQEFDEDRLRNLKGRLEGSIPNKDNKQLDLTLIINNEQRIPFKQQKQLLWRGARLMKTKWIYGLCVYTGRNTKIMRKSKEGRKKMSQVQMKINKIFIFILILQTTLCLIVGVLGGIFNQDNNATHTYIIWSHNPATNGVILFFSALVLIDTMIPISLIVSIEIVKILQRIFINNDRFMFNKDIQKGAVVNNISLNQQLGQIEHIFVDKTGTLTTNLMELKIMYIGTYMYGDMSKTTQNLNGFHDEKLKDLINQYSKPQIFTNAMQIKDRQKKICFYIKNQKDLAQEYLTALSITHQVVAIKDDNGKTKYQGSSSDEIALVNAASNMGFQFIKQTHSKTIIKIHGEQKQYELLEIFPFSFERKRMSVIVKDGEYIKIYTKGADEIIKKRLTDDHKIIEQFDKNLKRSSDIGLRTLLIAMRIISHKQYKEFKLKSDYLPFLPAKRRQKSRRELISDLESDLYLIGATAVQDKLQDQVPETIRDMIRAKIKVWMLTGDKLQTAENIAKSCNLIQKEFEILTVKYAERTDNGVMNSLKQLKQKCDNNFENKKKMALLIEGSDFAEIIKNDEFQDQFIAITEKCESVICYRLLPFQKAEIVELVKTKLKKITLAIGDGANDVPMIKAAHVGIGLFGREGISAVQACDYALPEFRMLWRLLFVHGRWNYIRTSEMILYFFYKNMLFTLPQFLYSFYCAYSGQLIIDQLYTLLFNIIFTSLPLIFRAIFDQDISYITKVDEKAKHNIQQNNVSTTKGMINQEILPNPDKKLIPKGYRINKYIYRLFPKLYDIGQKNTILNNSNFVIWIFEGILQSCLIFFSAFYIFHISINQSGYNSDIAIVSLVIYTTIVMIVSFKIAAHTKSLGWIFLLVLLFSIGLYLAFMWIHNQNQPSFINNALTLYFGSASTYFFVIFGICMILCVDGVIVLVNYYKSGIVGKLRTIINEEKEYNKNSYKQQNIEFSIGTNINRQIE